MYSNKKKNNLGIKLLVVDAGFVPLPLSANEPLSAPPTSSTGEELISESVLLKSLSCPEDRDSNPQPSGCKEAAIANGYYNHS